MSLPRALLSWSSGKDAAWSLHVVRQAGDLEVVGLVTTLNEEADRVAMHGVRHELLRLQAEAAGLPLYAIGLPSPCSNDEYEKRVGGRLQHLKAELGVTHMVFGDLFLADIRAYRERQMAEVGTLDGENPGGFPYRAGPPLGVQHGPGGQDPPCS